MRMSRPQTLYEFIGGLQAPHFDLEFDHLARLITVYDANISERQALGYLPTDLEAIQVPAFVYDEEEPPSGNPVWLVGTQEQLLPIFYLLQELHGTVRVLRQAMLETTPVPEWHKVHTAGLLADF